MSETIKICPQPGAQEMFLNTKADIAFYGGSAGSGKSYALLLEPLRHHNNPKFGGVIFRRQTTQVRNEGGLWQESHSLYPLLGAKPREMNLEWVFPSGMRMKFAHLEHEKSVLDWQGSQIAFLGFDEVTHFSQTQFWYMLSRNRSSSGVRGYVRATCNADAESWVRTLIDYWIGDDGYPIKARSGVLRWFVRQSNELIWSDTREALLERFGENCMPKSFTFISATLKDNQILMKNDPGYLANLMALDRVARAQLLDGNWNVRASAGMFFRKEYFRMIPAIQNATTVMKVRYWDRAATKPSEINKDPDWTVGLLLEKLNTGIWVISDIVRTRETPLRIEQVILNTASRDGYDCPIVLEQEPGSAGVADVQHMAALLAGYAVRIRKPTKAKEVRASAVSAQAEAGNIYMIKAGWNDSFFSEAENFPEGNHDDQIDALSGAFNELAQGASILDVL